MRLNGSSLQDLDKIHPLLGGVTMALAVVGALVLLPIVELDQARAWGTFIGCSAGGRLGLWARARAHDARQRS